MGGSTSIQVQYTRVSMHRAMELLQENAFSPSDGFCRVEAGEDQAEEAKEDALRPVCYDLDTLAMSFKSLEDYIGLQVALQTKHMKKLSKGGLAPSELKRLMRVGFPDAYKREFILSYYRIDMKKCAYDYDTLKKQMPDSILELY